MPRHLESKLQQSCVKWFDLQYPALRMNLFAIPNGGKRGKVEARIMKGEGVRAGVADMFLAVARQERVLKCNSEKVDIQSETWLSSDEMANGLFIEFKFGNGRQNDNQKRFEAAAKKHGYRYEIISDFDSFKNLVNEYLN